MYQYQYLGCDTIILKNVTIRGNWAKCIKALSVLFLITAHDSSNISIKISVKNCNKDITILVISSDLIMNTDLGVLIFKNYQVATEINKIQSLFWSVKRGQIREWQCDMLRTMTIYR